MSDVSQTNAPSDQAAPSPEKERTEPVIRAAGIAAGFNNIKIGRKIGINSGLILVFLLLVSTLAYLSISTANEDFGDYRQTARESNQLGRIQANLLSARIAVKNFIQEQTEESVKVVTRRIDTLSSLIDDTEQLMQDDAKTAALDTIRTEMQNYKTSFGKIIELFRDRNETVAKMNAIGPKAERNLTEIMNSAFRDGDPVASHQASITLRHLLLARLYANRFLIDNQESSKARALEEMTLFGDSAAKMRSELQNPTRQELSQAVLELTSDYKAAFAGAAKSILARNEIINGSLDVIGPRIADLTERMKLDNKKFQDEIGPKTSADLSRAVTVIKVSAFIALIVGSLLALFVGRAISRPISNMTGAMTRLAEGDKSTDIPATEQRDEIGDMANAVLVFKENMIRNDELQAAAAKEQAERNKRAEKVDALTKAFDEKAAEMLEVVASSAKELQETSTTLAAAAEESSVQASNVAAASTQASSNVQTVASSTEELTSSIREISQRVVESNKLTDAAVSDAETSRQMVQQLVTSSARIGEVVGMITDIADKTNLLALNATIEASRAGDAGKGFAVVASEVKSLANQTATATEEIRQQVEGIQNDTGTTAKTIDTISDRIQEVNEIAAAIAAAIEEQNVATQEISQNVSQVAASTQEVSSNIEGVNGASKDTSKSSTQVRESSESLNSRATDLKDLVQSFLTEVRAA